MKLIKKTAGKLLQALRDLSSEAPDDDNNMVEAVVVFCALAAVMGVAAYAIFMVVTA